jgi:parallel beta-helix repeat protein
VQAAVNAALPGETVSVAGTCNENIVIGNNKERITIEGVSQASINGTDPHSPTSNLRGKGILIRLLTITGGSDGIRANRASNAVIGTNYIHHTGGGGIAIEQLAYAAVIANTIQENPGAGIIMSEQSIARIGFNEEFQIIGFGNQIHYNGVGIVIADSSSARIVGNQISYNTGGGIAVLRRSQANISGNTIQVNGGHGIEIAENSVVQLEEDTGETPFDSPNWTFSNNAGFGIQCATAGIMDGRLGTLNGFSGVASFDGSCTDDLM